MSFESTRDSRSPPMAEINITPLVDVMLTVLIIFMITAPLVTHKIDLPLAASSREQSTLEPRVLGLSIKNSGELYLDGQSVNRAALDANLRLAKAGGLRVQLDVRPDAESAYDDLAHVLAIAKSNDVDDLRVEAPHRH